MDMLMDMFKGFLVGICASAPIGPIAILVVQKSLSKGHKAGFVSGLGASVVDTLYAFIAIFALAFAQKLIEQHQNLILLVGGLVLSVVGVSMAFSNPFRKMKKDGKSRVSTKDFAQAVIMGLSNPMAIFVMFTLFAFFGLAKDAPQTWSVAPILISVSLGSVTYWFSVSWLLSRFAKNFRMRTILWISRITGAIIVIIGIALFGQGLFNVVFRGMPIV
ncbi:MAG: LysE family transporter [Bacteroidales bacterium]|nr:LysE family transporter [Bacteroidales bacterium]